MFLSLRSKDNYLVLLFELKSILKWVKVDLYILFNNKINCDNYKVILKYNVI